MSKSMWTFSHRKNFVRRNNLLWSAYDFFRRGEEPYTIAILQGALRHTDCPKERKAILRMLRYFHFSYGRIGWRAKREYMNKRYSDR